MKIQIKISDNDKNIQIPITGINNLLGYDDNIQSIVNGETDTSINSTSDLEVRRFKQSSGITITFYFWDGSNFINELAPLDFAANSIGATSNQAKNSFYLIQIFDTYDEAIQKKLHTGYFNGYDFLTRATDLETTYTFSNTSEFLDLYINNKFLENLTGSTVNVYAKYLFYSGQSSKFYPFYPFSYQDTANKEEDIYQKIVLNLNNFNFNTSSFDVREITNPDYSTLINNTVSSIPVEKPKYPNGNTFTEDGNYITE